MGLPEGTITMYPKLERREWVFGTAPDPKDTRISELEKALREIVSTCERQELFSQNKVRSVYMIAQAALTTLPEVDTTKGDEDAT